MGQPRRRQCMLTRRNNTQRGAPDDNFVTARGQPQRNYGRSSSNSIKSHRNGRGHATIPPKTPKNLRPLINFVKTRDWEAIKASYGQYWYNIRNRLHIREDCLLIDERIVIPTQLRQTVLDSLHLTHPGSASILDLSHHVWFPHFHRSIVQMAQNCKHCTERGKNLKPIIGKKHSFQMEPVVERSEEVQLDFARRAPSG